MWFTETQRDPGGVDLLILLLSARLGVSSPCKQQKQTEHVTLWMEENKTTETLALRCTRPEWLLSLPLS